MKLQIVTVGLDEKAKQIPKSCHPEPRIAQVKFATCQSQLLCLSRTGHAQDCTEEAAALKHWPGKGAIPKRLVRLVWTEKEDTTSKAFSLST